MRQTLTKATLMIPVLVYTVFSAGPYVWTAMMSLRTTDEIYKSHYGLPVPPHFWKFVTAWTEFGYATYFKNSAIVTVTAVAIITMVGAMAGYGFARRRFAFPWREPLFLMLFLSIMFPPQIMILSLFQILIKYGLFNTLAGLILVYVATELPVTIYLLRAFFAQIPQELEEAARLCERAIAQAQAVSDLYAPVSGEVVEVNEALRDRPELVNNDPFGEGWIAKLTLGDPSELDGLMDAAAYGESTAG